ncbi:MAG: restriction endonuclease, partial [Desulfamplus sp.]|nr:restriction endonuclease [Desulfamplus sp.]
VDIQTIHDILVRLSRGDLLEYIELGGWFRKIKDPILVDFLRVWGRIIVEGKNQEVVASDLSKLYRKQKRQIADHKGYVAEIYIAQILWNMQRSQIPAKLIHYKRASNSGVENSGIKNSGVENSGIKNSDVKNSGIKNSGIKNSGIENRGEYVRIPDHFFYIWHRVKLGSGAGKEIDVYASAGPELWIVECKWYSDSRKVGLNKVKDFYDLKPVVLDHEGEGLEDLKLWYFSFSGFTGDAIDFMNQNGIMFSDKDDLNELLDIAGLRRLPEL